MTCGLRIEISGVVQGVGFRPWVYRLATEEGLAGSVRNDATGVMIEAFGSKEALDMFVQRLAQSAPPAAAIRQLHARAIPPVLTGAFRIVASGNARERRVSIPPDLPTCEACLSELFDPADRRYRYPFINCTNCGPRFTIVRDVPYDRAATTMAPFRMCSSCQAECDRPTDRRFHAEANACPECGPRLTLTTGDGTIVDCEDPVCAASAALASGRIVAIKGLGGFHLACDATSSEPVARLRQRKRRDEKPFAVMVGDLAHAEQIGALSDAERDLLTSVERPIVLARRHETSGLAPGVAPRNPLVGLLLPYTPLHHLIMREVARPLVMTSGNLSEEPIAYRNDEAVAHLGNVADLVLAHDREIVTRCDDSIARVIDGAPVLLRRSRGYVPRSITVPTFFDRPVLACGALLKNTFCIGAGDVAYLGPHIVDLENLDTYQAYEDAIERMERFLGIAPTVVGYDLHPEYLSTTYALSRPEIVKIGVQHHHAHVASAMAEHRLGGPVIGVAFDGTGHGTDGTAWGSEVLVAEYERFERVATMRPIALAGGDAAIRHPWRIALAILEDAFDGQAPLNSLRLFSLVPWQDVAVVRQMLAARLRSPLAHGAGRYFDAIGALALARPASKYEGQIALEWNVVADPTEKGTYAYVIDRGASPWVIDFRPMVRAVVRDLLANTPVPAISARFHNTLIAASADVVRATAAVYGRLPVVLTGGCFQNPRLAASLARELSSTFTVHLHHDVPPGDGGVALGQAVVAAARARHLGN